MTDGEAYGAEYAGFLEAFVRGYLGRVVSANAAVASDPARDLPVRTAATAAWEDHLIRVRRAESMARRTEDRARP